jgi:hypothetical protein
MGSVAETHHFFLSRYGNDRWYGSMKEHYVMQLQRQNRLLYFSSYSVKFKFINHFWPWFRFRLQEAKLSGSLQLRLASAAAPKTYVATVYRIAILYILKI